MSLLDKALAHNPQRGQASHIDADVGEQVDLAIAWARGDVRMVQCCAALGYKADATRQVAYTMARAFRIAIQSGRLIDTKAQGK